jgi:CSLREA domain-containing protein
LWLPSLPVQAPTTFTVNSTGDQNDLDFPGGTFDGSSDGACDVDSGTAGDQCTLRAAIQEANATTDADTINFNIGGSGVKTISPATSLPSITEPVTINGYTQSGADENEIPLARNGTDATLLIELNGAVVGSGNGLSIDASNVVVKGLVINRFSTGINVSGDGSGAVIEGNFIGTDPSGTQAVSSTGTGVVLFGGGANIIGGTSPAARNLISGNFRGFTIASNGGNTIQGNVIGTKANGTEPLGNTLEGVQISSSNNTVGAGAGVDDANANLIAFNGTDGVFVAASGAGNRILSNSIHSNGELGIDLAGGQEDINGVTRNDGRAKDRDTGANNLQNFPVLSSATSSGNQTTIKGKLRSAPSKSFTIQFFSSPLKDASGFGEGKEFIGKKDVRISREGTRSFSVTFTLSRDLQGEFVTATATRLVPDPSDPTTSLLTDTSEFSAAKEVT